MRKKTRNQLIEQKNKLYDKILKDFRPLIKKYGMRDVRLAVQRWAIKERTKNNLLERKAEIEEELKSL